MILLGNSPSSGSTLLADLLDSVPGLACGGELNLFSHPDLYLDFDRVRDKRPDRLCTPIPCFSRQDMVKPSSLEHYGLSKASFYAALKESPDFATLVGRIQERYLARRHAAVWVEKTPRNIFTAPLFLEQFPTSVFLHIVRDPAHVVHSLIENRGLAPYIAVATWLTSVSCAVAMKDHPRFFTIRYEDLVDDPFVAVCNWLRQVGRACDPDELAARYQANPIRRQIARLSGWTVTDYGRIRNANEEVDFTVPRPGLEYLERATVSDAYAGAFDVPRAAAVDVLELYGYPRRSQHQRGRIRRDWLSTKVLLRKFAVNYRAGDASLAAFHGFISPIQLDYRRSGGVSAPLSLARRQ